MLLKSHLFAQNNQIRAYTLEHGLPQSQVYDIVQDIIGYIWIGTQGGGIAKFDGNEFEIFNEKRGLISNQIHAISIIDNRIFIGTRYGLSIKNKNQFENYSSPQINKILDIDKLVYVATNKGFYWIDSKNKLVLKSITTEIDNSIINDVVYKNNWFWLATNSGLWKISSDFKSQERINPYNFTSIVFYKNKLISSSFNNGILELDLDTNTTQFVNQTKRINSLQIFSDNNLWISTDNNGIAIINAENYALTETINKKNGLSISHIRKCMMDKQSNVWVASSGGGLLKISENNFKHYDKDTGLKGNRIYAVKSINHEVWLSNSEEGLMKIDSLGIHKIDQDNGFLNLKVKTLANDNNGNVFAGTDGKGLLILHNSKKDSVISILKDDRYIQKDTIVDYSFTDTLNTKHHFPFDWIRKVHVRKNTIWVASYSGGIVEFRYDFKRKKVLSLKKYNHKNGIRDLYINDINSDDTGKLWYATKNGELGYIFKQKVTHLGKVLDKNRSIQTIIFHNNQLFLGTFGKGIWWSDLSKKLKFYQLTGKKELYSNNIYQLIFDNNNQLWAGSENGIDKISLNPDNLITDVNHFGRNDGFLGIETCLNSVTKDNDGNLWFGAIYGLTKLEPSLKERQQSKPNIYFEDIEVMNKSIDSLPTLLHENAILKLKPDQKHITFYYKTVDISHPKELKYRWKIDDSKWSNWSSDTKINIASNFGNHQFEVQSRNLSWQLSDAINFSFFIEKPLFKKAWFQRLLYGLAALFLLSLILIYLRRVKQKNKKEKAQLQIQNHLLSLEQKALQLQMNPHFIFNVLNGIKAMSSHNKADMNTTINKFATLLRNTLTNSRKNAITLQQEIITLKNYIEVEQLMSEKPFDYEIVTNLDLDTEEILIPPMLIQPFIENAIRHGIMAVKRKGKLSVTFSNNEQFLMCEIQDNGIGIHQSKQEKTKTSHQSMALQVTKERIEHLVGNNTMQVSEIVDKNNKPKGTLVKFKIPLETDY
jgi:ligand-binding sensor domain-containing protein